MKLVVTKRDRVEACSNDFSNVCLEIGVLTLSAGRLAFLGPSQTLSGPSLDPLSGRPCIFGTLSDPLRTLSGPSQRDTSHFWDPLRPSQDPLQTLSAEHLVYMRCSQTLSGPSQSFLCESDCILDAMQSSCWNLVRPTIR